MPIFVLLKDYMRLVTLPVILTGARGNQLELNTGGWQLSSVLAVAASQPDTEMAAVTELMRLDKMPTAAELRNGAIDLVGRVAAASVPQ